MSTPSIDTVSTTEVAYLIPPGTGELRWMGQTGTYFLATGQQTSGGFCRSMSGLSKERASPSTAMEATWNPSMSWKAHW